MLARVAVALLGIAPLAQAQVVEKVNGPLAGDVSRFTWTPDGRYVLYGAARNSPDIDVVTSLRVDDGSEVVYDPYASFPGTAHARGFAFPPDPGLVGVRYSSLDGTVFPPATGSPMYIIERSTGLPVSVTGDDPRFLDDGRVLFRTFTHVFHGYPYERGWTGRWDSASTPLEVSPPAEQGNSVSLILPATRAGVAVFGWRDTFFSANNAELFAVPLGGGALVPLTPPPASGGQRTGVSALHVRSSDELVIYLADEAIQWVSELWAVPVDGSLAPRRLNPSLAGGRHVSPGRVTPDETRIVFAADVEILEAYELWSTDIDSGTSVRLSGPMVTGGDLDDFWISPDGARVVYLADQATDGVDELFSAPIDGHAPAVRLHAALPANMDALTTVHFTPDGSLVVFALQKPSGVVLLAGPADGSAPPWSLNQPFAQGGGVLGGSSGILESVAVAPGGRHVFFLGEQDTDGVVELYSAPIDGSGPPRKWSAPLVAGGNVTAFALRPSPGAVLYHADQEVDERFELYLSELPDPAPRHAASTPPGP